MTTKQERLTQRTCALIKRNRMIILKRSDVYLGQWTNIAAGPDMASWTYKRGCALEIFSLEWAFAIAKLYNCKVYSVPL